MLKRNLKQPLLTLILMTTLLAALIVSVRKSEIVPNVPVAGPRGIHTPTWYCPPPPVLC